MGISDRILGKKNVTGNRTLRRSRPSFALAGGEVRITGQGLRPHELLRPKVKFGDFEGPGRGQFRRLSRHAGARRAFLARWWSPPTDTSAIRTP